MNLFRKFLFLVPCLLSLVASSTTAASLYFESSANQPAINEPWLVDLMLDPERESVNAVQGTVILPKDILEVSAVRDGNSIISFWVEKPHLECQESECQVAFSGIMPGGFLGVIAPYTQIFNPGKVLTLILEAKNTGSGTLDLRDSQVLLNDGLGTTASLTTKQFDFQTVSGPAEQLALPEDNTPPALFKPEVSHDPLIFSGQHFLAFAAQDKETGIDYYQVKESRFKNPWFRRWKLAVSPYLLADQKLTSYIFVKAVDKAGNEKIAVSNPQNPFKWYQSYWFYVIIIGGLMIASLLFKGKK